MAQKLYVNSYDSFIYSCPKLETTQVPFNR